MGEEAVFIGRFQPFHQGHAEMVDYVLDEYDELYVGIGIPENEFEDGERGRHDPLLYGEREAIISAVYPDVDVFGVEDRGDPELWVEEVEEQVEEYLEDEGFVPVTGNRYTAHCFEHMGYEVDFLENVEEEREVSGTRVRELAAEGGDWRRFVPENAVDVLEEEGFERIMRELAE